MTSSVDDTDLALLRRLAQEGPMHGEELGQSLGLSRAAVWKRIESLRQLGLQLEASRQQGYRLVAEPEWLDAKSLGQQLAATTRAKLQALEVLMSVDSTNAELMRAGLPHAHVLLAEHQSAGRGRRGRNWHSPLASNVYLSLGWHFPQGIAFLSRLGLALGVMVRRALLAKGIHGVRLKWPNDLMLEGAKVGGCLVEIRGDSDGPCRVVAGVGLNLGTPASLQLDQPWANLQSDNPDQPLRREALVVALLDTLVAGMAQFEQQGFEPFTADWDRADALRDRTVRVLPALPGELPWQGRARGLGRSGGLLVEREGQIQELLAGEVSVRADD